MSKQLKSSWNNFSENSIWSKQVNKVIQTYYHISWSLRYFKCITYYNIRKNLAESSVLLKIDFENVVFANRPKCLIKSSQPVQNTTADFALQKYLTKYDVIFLGWLPVIERKEINLAKIA